MNKEQEIERMAKIIDNSIYQYASNPYPPERDMHDCVAVDLVAHGIGDKKQAVKETLDVLQSVICDMRFGSGIDDKDFNNGYCFAIDFIEQKIDELFTELYGENK